MEFGSTGSVLQGCEIVGTDAAARQDADAAGTEAKDMLDNLHCSKLFFGVDGVDSEFGVTCATLEEAELLARMIKVSTVSVVLADSSKIGRRGFGRICEIQDVRVIVA